MKDMKDLYDLVMENLKRVASAINGDDVRETVELSPQAVQRMNIPELEENPKTRARKKEEYEARQCEKRMARIHELRDKGEIY
jgi:hypothetical protein